MTAHVILNPHDRKELQVHAKSCRACNPDLLVAIFPGENRRGYCPLSCSDEDLGSFIRQTKKMGVWAFAVIPDTADFCEEAI